MCLPATLDGVSFVFYVRYDVDMMTGRAFAAYFGS